MPYICFNLWTCYFIRPRMIRLPQPCMSINPECTSPHAGPMAFCSLTSCTIAAYWNIIQFQ